MYRKGGNDHDSDYKYKDSMITTLKDELRGLQHIQHELLTTNAKINQLQDEKIMLVDSKQQLQSQHNIKIDINKTNIAALRNDSDNFKIRIKKQEADIDELYREKEGLRRLLQNKKADKACFIKMNQQHERKNQQQDDQNRAYVAEIKRLKDKRNQLERESELQQKLFQDVLNELKGLEKTARTKDTENTRLRQTLAIAEQDHQDLKNEIKGKEEAVSASDRKLNQVGKEIAALNDKTGKLEKECIKSEEQHKTTLIQLENMIAANKELSKTCKELETTFMLNENDRDNIILQQEALSNEHMSLAQIHESLNKEIDQCILEIMEYEKINNELQKQIENYIKSDEQARYMLNRMEQMRDLLSDVKLKLTKTSEPISHLR